MLKALTFFSLEDIDIAFENLQKFELSSDCFEDMYINRSCPQGRCRAPHFKREWWNVREHHSDCGAN